MLTRRRLFIAILALFLVPIGVRAVHFVASDAPRSWHRADWSSAGMLPAAAECEPARVIVFAGQAGSWKGVFSVHSWIVLKRAGEPRWTRYDVVGWGNPVRLNHRAPDGLWYGNRPAAIADVSGVQAERLIPKIEAAVKSYAYARHGDYRVWPGPNSNSFVATVLRAVPELGIALPANAVGRDYREGVYAGLTDSGTGVELNLNGLAALKVGWVEGVELGLLGLVAGLDLRHPALKLPGYGRIGLEPTMATALTR